MAGGEVVAALTRPSAQARGRQLFAHGVALHKQGQLDQAMAAYRQVLGLLPSHPGALHHAGLVAFQFGDHNESVRLIGAALVLDPKAGAAHGDLGNAYRELGRFDEALASYGRALALDGGNPDLHYNHAHALQGLARYEEALESYGRAIALNPRDAQAYSNRAVVLKLLQRLDAALESCDKALAIAPRYAAAHSNRGNVLKELKRFEEALACHEKAIELDPVSAQTYFNHGAVLQELEKNDAAIDQYGRAIAADPSFMQAYYSRGILLLATKKPEVALQDFEQAIALQPDYREAQRARGVALFDLKRFGAALDSFEMMVREDSTDVDAHDQLGMVFHALGQYEEALASHDRAIELDPLLVLPHFHRGNVLSTLNLFEAALPSYQTAIALDPGFTNAYINIGAAFDSLGEHAAAFEHYDKAIAIEPECALAYWNRSLLHLQRGDFASGWRDYEWRWKAEPVSVSKERRDFAEPLWLGEQSLQGKTILLYGEQGFGDVLQFCRYAPLVAARGARVLLEAGAPLVDLLRTLDGVSDVIVKDSTLPSFDFQCPLMSLPLAFRTDLDSIPRFPRYLGSDAGKVARWESLLDKKLRIGIVWSGNPEHANDSNRSMTFAKFARLLSDQAQFVVLQKDVRPGDQAALDAHVQVMQAGGQLADFTDTAALCDAMDLVITVDTSLAHLAGALGKPVWIMLPANSDWRWPRSSSACRWYPSATLYRQPVLGEWEAVLERIAADLTHFITSGAHLLKQQCIAP